MDAMEALGDPVRRRIVEVLAAGTRPAGELARVVGDDFGISQPAASRHLRVLREAGLVENVVDGQRRLYSLRRDAIEDVGAWVDRVRGFWEQRLDALETEVAQGRRARPVHDESKETT